MSLSVFKPSLRRLTPFRLSYVACQNFTPTWSEKVICNSEMAIIREMAKYNCLFTFQIAMLL